MKNQKGKKTKLIGAQVRAVTPGGFTAELTDRRAGAALPKRKAGKRPPLHTAVSAAFDQWAHSKQRQADDWKNE